MILMATADAGTLSAIARHARRSTKRFGGALELFTVMEARLERRKEEAPWNLASARVLRYHEGFAGDVGRFAAGSYAIELHRMLVPHEIAEVEAYSWLLDFFGRYENALPGPEQMVVEELALLTVLGHAPRFDRCVTCGREAPERSWASFDHAAGGIVCRSCGGRGIRLGSRLRTFLIEANAAAESREVPGKIDASEVVILRRCLDLYVRAVADREPRSMTALRSAWGL